MRSLNTPLEGLVTKIIYQLFLTVVEVLGKNLLVNQAAAGSGGLFRVMCPESLSSALLRALI